MYRVLTIAQYIIEQNDLQNRTISNLKLQKILYFVQAEFLVVKDQPCFAEEIEAWSFGPVVPEVYMKYRFFGGAAIPVIRRRGVDAVISADDQELINGIMEECYHYSASALTYLSLRQSPWITAYKCRYSNVITKESIREYFLTD